MENKEYLLPEESSLVTEVNFAIKKYGLLKNVSDNAAREAISSERNWIINPDILPTIESKFRESALRTPADSKDLSYLRDLTERLKVQKEIVMNSKFSFDMEASPEKLVEIKSLSYPAIAKSFNFHFKTPQEKYETFNALANLQELRPYLEKIQPFLNHSSGMFIPVNGQPRPRQIEIALPLLYQIEQAKERGVADRSIDVAIDLLNRGKIGSPEHFQNVIQDIDSKEFTFDENFIPELDKTVPEDVLNEIKQTASDVVSLGNIPLSKTSVSVMAQAKMPELAKEIGWLMANREVTPEIASAIVDNVNAISNARDDVDVHHLTQTLAMVAKSSNMTPAEMTILGDIILNNKTDLSFGGIRLASKEIKNMDVRGWAPPSEKETAKNKDKEKVSEPQR